MRSRSGFTLIELLIVIVIVGILAAIAVVNFTNTKQKAYMASEKTDLRNLVVAEEALFYDSAFYTTSFVLMNNYTPSPGNTIVVNEATGQGWSATASNVNTTKKCYLFTGNAALVGSATKEGLISCS
jgi:prepilin-type N-terminal cleavage/methylation domain-containing protein